MVTARTWPLPPTYAVFGREYQFYKEDGALAGNASSRWCAVHLPTGKLQPSKFLDNQDYSTYNTDRALEVKNWKIPVFDVQDGELRFSLTIANSEYDHYMHVNNTRYADYCFNAFTVEELQKAKLKSFAISYVRQCREGDELRFYRKYENGAYYVQGVNQSGEIVVQSEIVFIP
jgi:acyl-ACP thioesterase